MKILTKSSDYWYRWCVPTVLILTLLFVQFSIVHAQQERPFSGERVYFNGIFWIKDQNNTIPQLDGFTTIRLSSNVIDSTRAKYLASLGKDLMVGLSKGHMLPDEPEWPGTVLADSNTTGPLFTFKRGLNSWSNAGIQLSDVFFNLEVPHSVVTGSNPKYSSWTPKAVSGLYADLIHAYKRALRDKYPQARLWVYSTAHAVDTLGTYLEYEGYSCDWEAITSGPDAPDLGLTNAWLASVPEHFEGQLKEARKYINDTKPLMNDVPFVVSFATREVKTEDPWSQDFDTATYIRNTYQNHWQNFQTFIRVAKAIADSINNIDSPTLWYQLHYLNYRKRQHQGTPEVPPGSGNYTKPPPSRNNFAKPFRDIPYIDAYDYPARLWEKGAANWDWSRSVNQWEAEMIANYLKATGYDVPGRQITSNTTWRDEIVLLGDVEIASGVTLTIQSGTRIFFRPNVDIYEAGSDTTLSEIIIQPGGALSAVATAGDSIVFQSSLAIDSYGTPGRDDWGGIRNDGGTLTLQNCIIRDAKVGVEVTSYRGKTTISETDLSSNFLGMKVREGASAARLELSNIGLYQNMKGLVADIYGTGLVALRNATIADNYQGIGFAEEGANPTMQLKNTIVAFNTEGIYTRGLIGSLRSDPDSSSTKPSIPVLSPTLNLLYCDVYGSAANDFKGVYKAMPTRARGNVGNVSVNPKFVVHIDTLITQSDYHLQASSPLIDAGDPSMVDPDSSRINMGRYGGTAGYTAAPDTSRGSSKPVVSGTEETPAVFAMFQNAPNPFNPETIISYVLPQSERVKLVIYNVLGQEVRTLVDAFKPAGNYRVVWNSRDDFGRPVSSGIYLYRIAAGDFTDTRKMLI